MLSKIGSLFNDLLRLLDRGTAVGLAGDDTLIGSESRDHLYGGDGNDVIRGRGGHDIIDTGTGAFDVAKGGLGHDLISTESDVSYIYGGAAGDTIHAYGGGYHALFGDRGNDHIFGGDGNDWIDGGAGNDELHGGGGQNVLFGGKGSDTLYADDGYSALYGGAGSDHLVVNGGLVTLLDGGAGFDDATIEASWIYGDISYDYSAKGTDAYLDGSAFLRVKSVEQFLVNSGHGNDDLTLGAGNDTIYGNDGDDDIDGGAGNDLISGGAGADELTGGTGADRFVFGLESVVVASASADKVAAVVSGPAYDHITDFSVSENDHLDLSGLGAGFVFVGSDPFTDVGQVHAYSDGLGNTVVEANVSGDLAADLVIILDSFADPLTATSFIF